MFYNISVKDVLGSTFTAFSDFFLLSKIREASDKFQNDEYMFKCLGNLFGRKSTSFELIVKASIESERTHNGGKRKNGDLLKTHERGMAGIAYAIGIKVYFIYIVIFLHDMNEDYPELWPLERIEKDYGSVVAFLVNALSKPKKSPYLTDAEYDEEIFSKVYAGGYWAWVIKCIDRLHNMITLYGTHEKMVNKINQSIQYVLPLSIRCNTLTRELMAAINEQVSKHKMKSKFSF